MERRDYEQILDAMPKTALYVIREDDHKILYYNKRVHTLSPEVRPGMTCHEVWTGSCSNCPLLTIHDRQEGHSISYNPTFGGVVDMVATRILWQDSIPAFVVTVTPRLETAGYTYRKILRVNLNQDSYEALKLEPDAWLTEKDTTHFSLQMEKLAESGAIHPDDKERFLTFIRPARLKEALRSDKQKLTCIYRRQRNGDFRWNLIEVVKCFDFSEHNQSVIFCVMDVHDTMREGLEREEANVQNTWLDMQMAAILKSRYSRLNTVHLDSGKCEQICLSEEGDLPKPLIGDYDYYMHQALYNHVHSDDVAKYVKILSLEHLRKKAAETENCSEEICQYRLKGEPVHWIEQHVIYSRKNDKVTVNILGQDITSQKHQEETQLQALQDRSYIISSLSSLFFSTYYIDLAQDTFRAVTQLGKVGDVLGSAVNCTTALKIYAENFVHPDDRAEYSEIMNISNWIRSLRWWNPYVTITYRKMPDDPQAGPENYRWIRATAALAQAGEDDIPRTVVYVAQDITESREKKV